MILILDSDYLTIMQRETEPIYSRLVFRLQPFANENVCTTIINFEEQARGWLAFIANAKQNHQEIVAYKRPHRLLTFYGDLVVLDYDQDAAEQFTKLRQMKLKVGTMDLKIAAIAISQNALLLSRNLKDFRQISDLRVEDWTL
jgi:tRNA(fMet)-specific endonuclease VapC